MFLAGLWCSKKKPNMQTFCRPIIENINGLYHSGMYRILGSNNINIAGLALQANKVYCDIIVLKEGLYAITGHHTINHLLITSVSKKQGNKFINIIINLRGGFQTANFRLKILNLQLLKFACK